MKYLSAIFFCLVTVQAIFASTVELYVHNANQTETLTVEKPNGEKIVVPPNTYLQHISFDENSEPNAVVAGKFMCKWTRLYSDDKHKLVGLTYDNPYGSKYDCLTMYMQSAKS